MSLHRLPIGLALAVAMSGAACGDPPDREIRQAQSAIDAAKAAGADQYSHDELVAAQDALKHATGAVADRDYRQALNDALYARERAQVAAKEASDGKAKARADAERAMAAAMAAVDEARTRLKIAEAPRAPSRALAESRRTIATVEGSLQEARAAMERGDYLVAAAKSTSATERLRAVARDLGGPVPPAARRRR